MKYILAFFRVILRTTAFSISLVCYFLVSFIIFVFSGLNFDRARPHLTKVIAATSIVGLKIFNVKVSKHTFQSEKFSNYLIISNHLSYLDILIISIYFPSCFVTSKEMKHTPFLGQVCLLGGCLFVERRKRSGLNDEVKELSESLKRGLNVTIFPEAKSTNGEAVISFKRPLFQAAMISQVRVLPVCINYLTLDGEKLTVKNRDNVFWYGDKAFLTHVLNLFSHHGLTAELIVLPSLDPADSADKTALTDKTYASISSAYKAIKEL